MSHADRLNRGDSVAPRGASVLQAWRCRATGTIVAVYTASDAGLDPAFPWYASCETHSTALGCDTKDGAMSAARYPASFCDACRESTK